MLGLAQTGTGKTAAFVLPILQRLLGTKGQALRALVLTPTRELAAQVHAEFERLARHTQLTSAVVFGGVPIPRQERALKRRPDVVVACPGRLLDLLGRGTLRLDRVEVLVLDEADHMFDMGFLPDVRRILAALPERRQNLLFSATMPPEIRKLADRVLRKPAVVELAHSKPAETIDHVLYSVAEAQKVLALERLLADRSFRSAIVFMRTKRRTRRLQQQLDRAGHRVVALQGNMSQSQRDRAMRGFREGRFDVLVATDIAARGLDVAGVSHVVNFDVPSTPDAYTHRVGRTGRSGLSGTAFTFGTSADAAALRAIERQLGYPIPRRSLDELGLAGARPQRAEARTQGSGARPPRAGARPPRAAEQAASKRPRANQRRSKPNRAKQGARPGPRRAPATRRHPERSVPAELPSFGQGVHDAPVERPA